MKTAAAYLLFLFASIGVVAWAGMGSPQNPIAYALVQLQSSTPGTTQNGHTNIAGTSIAGQFVGAGSGLTALNASNLGAGTVPPGRIAGAYPGITGLGTVSSGTWNGGIIGSAFGGTGLNTSAASTGSMLYASGPGVWATRAIGVTEQVLRVGSNGLPIWGRDSLSLPFSGS